MEQLVEGNVSGRDRIYANIFNGWLESDSIMNLFFGYGFAGSRPLSGFDSYAHNDWLELLSNFGLLGVTIYFVLFYSIFKTIRNSSWGNDKKIIFLTIMGMWFATTLFSMGYTSMGGYLNAMMLAYLLGSSKNLV
jgi:O-antigen ligase